MRIPPRYQRLLDDEQETVERIRPHRGARLGAVNTTRRATAIAHSRRESGGVVRAARAVKVRLEAPEDVETIRALAWEAYCGRHPGRRPSRAQPNVDRVTVNFLRHYRTTYEDRLRESAAAAGGTRDLYRRQLKLRCLDEIAHRYPELAEACERQAAPVRGLSQAAVDEAWGQALAA